MNAKLTDTQNAILKTAADRPDGNIEPLPPNLRGGARTKVIGGLLSRGLIAEADDRHLLTDAGYAAVGKRRRIPKGIQKLDAKDGVAKRDALDALAKREATHDLQELEATTRTIRSGTKLAAIIDAMSHPGGATVAQMMAGTGWQAHTVRGAISGMVRNRLGHEVVTEKSADGQRTYRIA